MVSEVLGYEVHSFSLPAHVLIIPPSGLSIRMFISHFALIPIIGMNVLYVKIFYYVHVKITDHIQLMHQSPFFHYYRLFSYQSLHSAVCLHGFGLEASWDTSGCH